MRKNAFLTPFARQKINALSSSYFNRGGARLGGFYHRASQKDTEGERARRMVGLVNTSELEMVKMSEALRGYLLNPSNQDEYTRKKAADEAYGKNTEELGTLLKDAPEILALNQKMADYDANDLDKIENGVADLIEKHSPEAVTYYTAKYIPARKVQTENFMKLKELVNGKASSILSAIEARRLSDAVLSIVMLLASVFFGMACVVFITATNLKRAKSLFDRVYGVSDQVNGRASELLDSSVELSESVNEQAAAIQETAASLDEVTAMVKKNSDNALQSKNFARETKKVTFVRFESRSRLAISN